MRIQLRLFTKCDSFNFGKLLYNHEMKYTILITLALLFHGCLYFNDRGVSGHLYDNCHNYYDAYGHYHESCDENIIDYEEAKQGVVEIKDEISDSISERWESECDCTKEISGSKPCACR